MNLQVRNAEACAGVNFSLAAVVLACSALLPHALCYGSQQSQVSQFGITWTFDKDYVVGQFANGDYWVVGPVTITRISPASVDVDGRIINGSMVNPSPRLVYTQGYDSAMFGQYAHYGEYDASLNAARPNGRDLSAGNSLVVNPHSSLVSTISTEQADGRNQLKTAAILTVLDAAAPEGAFRPPYCGSDKTVKSNVSQLDYSLLASLTPVPGAPSLSTVERYFERPWLDHIPLWMADAQHPVENMPSYGREIATQVGIGALMLHLNFSNERKERLLVRYVQLGIDLFGIIQDGGEGNWIGMGGIANGRKYPILFAALMLDAPDMKKIGEKSGDYLYSSGHGPGNKPPDYIHFGEDDQTFYVTQADVDVTHSPQWNPDKRDTQMIPYESEDIGLAEWGITHATDPSTSNKFWETAYRQVSGPCWGGYTLAAHIMGMKDLWNHDAFFDYVDRYMREATDYRQTNAFVERMWDTYRANYGPASTMSPTLTTIAVGGLVAVAPDRTTYALGERVRIRAVADPGYEFTGWSGGLVGQDNPTVIIMDANHSVTANFEARSKMTGSKSSKPAYEQ